MSVKRARFLIMLFAALCLLSFAVACGSDEDDDIAEDDEAAPTEAASGVKYKPSGNEGTLAGTIAFDGAPPAPKPISMDADAACANPSATVEDLVVKDGRLQNVFIYIKDGKTTDGGRNITALAFDPPAEARVLDQKGCQYTPHVVGIQTGQKLSVLNSDQTSHNVNVQAKSNPQFNQSQPNNAAPIEKTFARAETLIPVKCNVHPWMKSYINVMRHPFYAVSAADGKFEIKNVPPGTYNVVAWHETLGEKTQSVTVGAKESKTQDFSFAGKGTTASFGGSSLEILPALDFPMLGKH
ncbi:MAG TPA: carboxypeptidase regulatory-like domain-containing protein [Pyrinomonadaceae bacterium]|nr:carboxypeptidase regulatory-like domain-containing protein [Pyrinomonadaceae bacterium]